MQVTFNLPDIFAVSWCFLVLSGGCFPHCDSTSPREIWVSAKCSTTVNTDEESATEYEKERIENLTEEDLCDGAEIALSNKQKSLQ